MEAHFTENLSTPDRIVRALVGVALVFVSSMLLVLSPALIGLLCLLAVYPLMTAMIGWDPFIAAATFIHHRLSASVVPASRPSRMAGV